MRWRTRTSSVLIKKTNAREDKGDTIDIMKSSVETEIPSKRSDASSTSKKKPEVLPTGAGYLGVLDKVKEPKFLAVKKEKRNNIKLNL